MSYRMTMSCLLIVAGLTLGQVASAADGKDYHASVFQCFGGLTSSACADLSQGVNGLTNNSASFSRLAYFAPMRDAGTDLVDITVFSPNRGSTACLVFITDFTTGNQVGSTVFLDPAPGAQQFQLRKTNISTGGQPFFLLCNVSPGVRLAAVDVGEH